MAEFHFAALVFRVPAVVHAGWYTATVIEQSQEATILLFLQRQVKMYSDKQSDVCC